MKKEIFQVKNLMVSINDKPVLHNVRINLYQGEILGLIGLNGSGKSVLTKALAGRIPVKEGTLFLRYEKISLPSEKEARNAGLYLIDKQTRLIRDLSVLDNLIVSWKSLKTGPPKKNLYIRRIFDTAADLDIDLKLSQRAGNLTIGEQFRMEIIKAYTLGVQIILIDSIFEICSLKEADSLRVLIKKMQERGTSFIVTDHKFQDELPFYNRIGVMHAGQVIRYLNRKEFDRDYINNLAIGHSNITAFVRQNRPIGEALFRLEHLSGPSLEDFSLTLHQGEILGICDIEEDAARDLVMILSGLQQEYEGDIYFKDRKMVFHSIQDAVRSGVGIISERFFQKNTFSHLSPLENMYFPILKRTSGFLGVIPSRIRKYMEKTYGKDFSSLPLSRQDHFRLQANKWLLRKSCLLLLDNTANNADVIAKRAIYSTIEEIAMKGMTMMLFSTDLSEIAALCDRILLMKNGSVYDNIPITNTNRNDIEELKL